MHERARAYVCRRIGDLRERYASIDAVAGQGITLTLETTEVARTREALEQRGIVTTPIEQRWGADVFYCQDPEGHRIEFWAERAPTG